jgi:hypothetical protein
MTTAYVRADQLRDLIARLDKALDVLVDNPSDAKDVVRLFADESEQIQAAISQALSFLYEQPEEDNIMSASPTCVVEFVDGQITRMTTWSANGMPDARRGIKLARHAYRSRTGREPPVHFLSDGGEGLPLMPEEIERAAR